MSVYIEILRKRSVSDSETSFGGERYKFFFHGKCKTGWKYCCNCFSDSDNYKRKENYPITHLKTKIHRNIIYPRIMQPKCNYHWKFNTLCAILPSTRTTTLEYEKHKIHFMKLPPLRKKENHENQFYRLS